MYPTTKPYYLKRIPEYEQFLFHLEILILYKKYVLLKETPTKAGAILRALYIIIKNFQDDGKYIGQFDNTSTLSACFLCAETNSFITNIIRKMWNEYNKLRYIHYCHALQRAIIIYLDSNPELFDICTTEYSPALYEDKPAIWEEDQANKNQLQNADETGRHNKIRLFTFIQLMKSRLFSPASFIEVLLNNYRNAPLYLQTYILTAPYPDEIPDLSCKVPELLKREKEEKDALTRALSFSKNRPPLYIKKEPVSWLLLPLEQNPLFPNHKDNACLAIAMSFQKKDLTFRSVKNVIRHICTTNDLSQPFDVYFLGTTCKDPKDRHFGFSQWCYAGNSR